jgi:hypothetical protein
MFKIVTKQGYSCQRNNPNYHIPALLVYQLMEGGEGRMLEYEFATVYV